MNIGKIYYVWLVALLIGVFLYGCEIKKNNEARNYNSEVNIEVVQPNDPGYKKFDIDTW